MYKGEPEPKKLETFLSVGEDSFKVTLDKENYYEGGTAEGSLEFKTTQELRSFKIYIRLLGGENVECFRVELQSDGLRHYVTHCTSKNFLDDRALVIQSNENIEPGEYSYRFKYNIPNGIPGSYGFKTSEENWNQGTVKYRFYCEIETQDDLVGRATCNIAILQCPRIAPQTDIQLESRKKYLACCIIPKGAISLKCVFNSNVFKFQDSFKVTYSIDLSKSKISVKKLRLVMERKVKLKSSQCGTLHFSKNVLSYNLGAVEKGTSIKDKIAELTFREARDENSPSNLPPSLRYYSGMIQPTCSGSIVSNKYELKIIVVPEGKSRSLMTQTILLPFNLTSPQDTNEIIENIRAQSKEPIAQDQANNKQNEQAC